MTAAKTSQLYPEQHKLAIIGDRQDGKTYLAELFAVTEAYKGQKVLYDCYSADYAQQVLLDCVEMADMFRFPVRMVRKTNGKLMIDFYSGGCIWFEPVRRTSGRGYTVDVHVLDGCGYEYEGHWTAKRIFRTVVR